MNTKTIFALTDYKGNFESKYNAHPYNSGMDKKLLKNYFSALNFEIKFIPIPDVINYPNDFWEDITVIYTSAEDTGYYYKDFIEDIVYYLELSKANVIPPFKYLRANNNKVFMELLRHQFNKEIFNLRSMVFGCLEEAVDNCNKLTYPLVYKQAAGAMSEGVGLIKRQGDLIRKLKRISRTPNLFRELWEYGRSLKYKEYDRESKYRNKFIVQDFIEGLSGDYKVLIFGDKYYVLKRDNKKDDFRASGSGIRNFVRKIPHGLLEYAHLCLKTIDVPNISVDIGYKGESFFLIEFQCLYFGSYTITYSDFYWQRSGNDVFELKEEKSILEEEYARSVVKFCTHYESTIRK